MNGRWNPLYATPELLRQADEGIGLALARKRRETLVGEWRFAQNVMTATARISKRPQSTKVERDKRNFLIVALCETHPVAHVSRLTGFSRMRIYQILNCRKILQTEEGKNSSA